MPPPRADDDGNMADLAVILRSHDEASSVERTVRAVLAQQGVRLDVLAIDSGSTDGTWEILESLPVRRLRIRPSEYVPGAVLNLGASLTRAPILVFLNADATPTDSRFLQRLVTPLLADTADAVWARQLPRIGAPPHVVRDYRSAFPPPGTARRKGRDPDPSWGAFFSMVASATTRETWLASAFDPTLAYSEDVAWARVLRRDGRRVAYVPGATVLQSHDPGPLAAWRRAHGEGAADARVFPDVEVRGLGRTLRVVARAAAADLAASLRLGRPWTWPRAVSVRAAWHLGRHAGQRDGRDGRAGRVIAVPAFARLQETPRESRREGPDGVAFEALLLRVADAVERVLPERHGARLFLVGSHGRGDGAHRVEHGRAVPTNNLDLLLVAPDRRRARSWRARVEDAHADLQREVHADLDFWVASERSLRRARPSLLLYDAGHAHRVLLGSAREALPWRTPRPEELVPGEMLRLFLNRGILLLANRFIRGGVETDLLLRHAVKGILGIGDAALMTVGRYHPREARRLAALRGSALGRFPGADAFTELYADALAIRRTPPAGPPGEASIDLEVRAVESAGPLLLAVESERLGSVPTSWDAWSAAIRRERPFRRRGVSGFGDPFGVSERRLHAILARLPHHLFGRVHDREASVATPARA